MATAHDDDRLALLEQLVARQQEEFRGRFAQQETEIARLRAALAEAAAEPAAPARSGRTQPGATHRLKSSRRTLLKLGGAAAAASATAVALGTHQEAHAANGSNFILGQSNNAGTVTDLVPTTSTTPNTLLNVDNSSVNNGTAVQGRGAPGGAGVFGSNSGSGYGVWGISDSGAGVHGQSGLDGLSGTGGRYGGNFSGSAAPLFLGTAALTGAPSTGMHNAGEVLINHTGVMWVCIVGNGTDLGTWVRLTSVVSGASGGATTYLSKPIRLLDTRSGAVDALNNGGGPYAGSSTHSLTIAGVSFNSVTVPAGAVGAIGNVAVLAGSGGGGYLALVPQGAGFSGTANVGYAANQVVGNSFNVGMSGGALDIIIGGGATDVIIDLFAVVA